MNAEPHSPITRHLLITGHGRAWAIAGPWVQAAHHLGVTGWVRNRRDGRVEACAWGSEQAVQALIDWARQGPEPMRVWTAWWSATCRTAARHRRRFVPRETVWAVEALAAAS